MFYNLEHHIFLSLPPFVLMAHQAISATAIISTYVNSSSAGMLGSEVLE
jgi:hypothetical protein